MSPTLINSYSLSPIIGIGTHTPNESLTVVGNISATGTVYSNTATFASSISATQEVRANVIVANSITDTHGGTLVKKKTFPIIGDGLAQQFTLNHGFDTYGILIQVYEYDTKEAVICYSKNIDLNNTVINTGTTLNAGVTGYLVVLFG